MNFTRTPLPAAIFAAIIAVLGLAGPPEARAAGDSPICEICPTCANCRPLCTPDRTLTISGTPLSDYNIGSTTTVSDLGQLADGLGPRCDCTIGDDVYSPYSGKVSTDESLGHRLPACTAERVQTTVPLATCSTPWGSVDEAPIVAFATGGFPRRWPVGLARQKCLIQEVPACPPGYARVGGTSGDAFTYGQTNLCRATTTALTPRPEIAWLPTERSQRHDYYVTAWTVWNFPSSAPRIGACPDGSNADADDQCVQDYAPSSIFQRRADLESDYSAAELALRAPAFFGDPADPESIYHPDTPTPTLGEGPELSTDSPEADLDVAFPLLAGDLAATSVGATMAAERAQQAAVFSSLVHLDGTEGRHCEADRYGGGYDIYRANRVPKTIWQYFEDGSSCPISAPLDANTNRCVSTDPVPVVRATVAPTSTPSLNCPVGRLWSRCMGTPTRPFRSAGIAARTTCRPIT